MNNLFSSDLIKYIFNDESREYMFNNIYQKTGVNINLQTYLFIVDYYINRYLDLDIVWENLNEYQFSEKCNMRIDELINVACIFIRTFEENNVVIEENYNQYNEYAPYDDNIKENKLLNNEENYISNDDSNNNSNLISIKKIKDDN